MRSLAALLLGALAACAANDSDAAQRREDTTGRRDSVAGVAASTLTDPALIGLLEAVNASDSALGALGAQKATSTDVKEFARMILREHMALRRDAADLARQLGVTPESPKTPPADAPAAMRQDVVSQPAGPAWDRLYLQYAIAMHDAAMENTARALAATTRPEIKQLIERSVPILDKHLAKARVLEKRTGVAPSTAPTRTGARR